MTDRLHGQKEQEEPGRGPHCRSGQVPPSSLSHVISIGSSYHAAPPATVPDLSQTPQQRAVLPRDRMSHTLVSYSGGDPGKEETVTSLGRKRMRVQVSKL